MASKDNKGREDLDDLGLKDRVLFQLTLRFSDLDLLKTLVIKMQRFNSNLKCANKRKSDRRMNTPRRFRVNKIKARAPRGPPRQRIESSFPLAFKMVFDSF